MHSGISFLNIKIRLSLLKQGILKKKKNSEGQRKHDLEPIYKLSPRCVFYILCEKNVHFARQINHCFQ